MRVEGQVPSLSHDFQKTGAYSIFLPPLAVGMRVKISSQEISLLKTRNLQIDPFFFFKIYLR